MTSTVFSALYTIFNIFLTSGSIVTSLYPHIGTVTC
jgi:hypothetical protein